MQRYRIRKDATMAFHTLRRDEPFMECVLVLTVALGVSFAIKVFWHFTPPF